MLPTVVEQPRYIGKEKLWLTAEVLQQREAEDQHLFKRTQIAVKNKNVHDSHV